MVQIHPYLVHDKHESLTTVVEEVGEENFDLNKTVAIALEEVMKNLGETTVGLASNQLGFIRGRVFGIYNRQRNIQIFVNPKILNRSDEKTTQVEGCLSFPGVPLKVSRSNWIDVEYQDISGKVHTGRIVGFDARVFQHELDHLNGVRFYDVVSKMRKDAFMKKYNKLWKGRAVRKSLGGRP